MTKELNILEGWEEVALGDVANETVDRGGPIAENFSYVDIGSIDREAKQIMDAKDLASAEAPSRAKQVLQSGDILVSMTRPNLNSVALVTSRFDGAIGSTGFHVLRSTCVESKFLFYLVQTRQFIEKMSASVQGALYPAIRPKDILDFRFSMPSRVVQQRIVAKIDELFSELDKGVENLKAARQQIKVYRQALLKHAFEGKLTAQWRAENYGKLESGEALLSIIKQRREQRFQQQFADWEAAGKQGGKPKVLKSLPPLTTQDLSELSELPTGWAWTRIDAVTNCLDYLRKPINKLDRLIRQGSVPYFGANGQVGWINDFIFDEPLVLVVEDETFTGREKPFSYKIVGKSWVNNHAHILQPLNGLDIDYLNFQLFYYPLTRLTTGTTGRKKLTKEALMNAPIKICSFREQVEISKRVEAQISEIEQFDQVITLALQQAAAMRQSILRRAFSGQLVQIDKQDESAATLPACAKSLSSNRADSKRVFA